MYRSPVAVSSVMSPSCESVLSNRNDVRESIQAVQLWQRRQVVIYLLEPALAARDVLDLPLVNGRHVTLTDVEQAEVLQHRSRSLPQRGTADTMIVSRTYLDTGNRLAFPHRRHPPSTSVTTDFMILPSLQHPLAIQGFAKWIYDRRATDCYNPVAVK